MKLLVNHIWTVMGRFPVNYLNFFFIYLEIQSQLSILWFHQRVRT